MNTMKSERKYYLDNIRWATVILVVIYHALMLCSGVTPLGITEEIHIYDSFMYFVYPWFMMILFMVSGACTQISLKRNPNHKQFIKKRNVAYLVPSTIGLFAFQWVQGYLNMLLNHAFETLPDTMPKPIIFLIVCLSGTGVLWYLQVLWVLSLLLVLVRKITRQKEISEFPVWGLLLMTIPAIGFALILNTPIITTYRFGIYGFAFFTGYYLLSNEKLIDDLAKYSVPMMIVSVLMGIFCTVYFWGQNFADTSVVSHPFNTAYGWLMSLSIFGMMKKYGNHQTKITAWLTKKNFGLYVFHYLGISACIYLLDNYTNLPIAVCCLLSLISGFAVGYGLYEIISRIPVLRWCVLGISKRKE